MRTLPALVSKLGICANAWLVGSAADPSNKRIVRDYDVIVPFSYWNTAAMLIPKDAKPNTFGGWKCKSEGVPIDVWPGDLSEIGLNKLFRYAVHIRTGTTIKKIQ